MDTCSLDTIAAMRRQEDTSYQTGDFLSLAADACKFLDVDADCRTMMAEWCYQVVDFCKFQRESVEIAMNFLDRYLLVDTFALNDRATYQLAAMTSLYMAVKIHEAEAMDPATVSTLSRGTYSANDIEDMELEILNALQWRVNPPTSASFAREMLSLLPDDSLTPTQRNTVEQITTLQLELAVADYDMIAVKPSTTAFCSITNAIESIALEPKARSCIRFILSKAIGIEGNDEDIAELSDYLYASVARREPTIWVSRHAQPVKAAQSSFQRRASFEVSPRTTAIR